MKKITFIINNGKYAGKEIVEHSAASVDSLKLRAMALGWTLKSVEE